MKPISSFQFFCLATFGNPVEDRKIYRTIRKHKVASIVEIGLGDGSRAANMIRVAKKYSLTKNIRYTGVDLFEGREPGQPQLALRDMHKQLSSSGAKIQLVPGDLSSALPRIANSHIRTDLILFSAGQPESELDNCWFYFPRMLHAGSVFMVQTDAGQPYELMSRMKIERKAEQHSIRRAA